MSHKYRDYSKQKVKVVEEKNVAETPVEVIEEIVEETTSTTKGIVIDCQKLNVRKTPSKFADVLTRIDAGTSVEIDTTKSTIGFYKITTAAGVEGYCVKDFIAVV